MDQRLDCSYSLDQSWEFLVLIGPGPVQSQSFSSLVTGPSNTNYTRVNSSKLVARQLWLHSHCDSAGVHKLEETSGLVCFFVAFQLLIKTWSWFGVRGKGMWGDILQMRASSKLSGFANEECDICYGVKRGNVSRSGTTQKSTNTNTKSTPTQKHKSHVLIVWGETLGYAQNRSTIGGLNILGC